MKILVLGSSAGALTNTSSSGAGDGLRPDVISITSGAMQGRVKPTGNGRRPALSATGAWSGEE